MYTYVKEHLSCPSLYVKTNMFIRYAFFFVYTRYIDLSNVFSLLLRTKVMFALFYKKDVRYDCINYFCLLQMALSKEYDDMQRPESTGRSTSRVSFNDDSESDDEDNLTKSARSNASSIPTAVTSHIWRVCLTYIAAIV